MIPPNAVDAFAADVDRIRASVIAPLLSTIDGMTEPMRALCIVDGSAGDNLRALLDALRESQSAAWALDSGMAGVADSARRLAATQSEMNGSQRKEAPDPLCQT